MRRGIFLLIVLGLIIVMSGFVFVLAIVPTHENPLLNSTYNTNKTHENLTCYNQSTADNDIGDKVKNIYNFYKNDNPVTFLNMPFESNNSGGTSITKDYSGYNNNGTVNGALFNATAGYDGFGAYEFDGVDDWINISNENLLEDWTEGTICLWFYTKESGANQGLVSDRSSILDNNWTMIGINSQNKITFGCKKDGTEYTMVTGGIIQTDTWYHLCGTWNSTGLYKYINGALNESTTAKQCTGVSNTFHVRIGTYYAGGTSYSFNGTIDDILIYNQSLSSTKINSIYANETNIILSEETGVGEVWKCEVTPTDGDVDGSPKNSTDLTILAKEAPNSTVAITPSVVYSCDDYLFGYANYSDPENDTELGSECKWYKNGVEFGSCYSSQLMLLNFEDTNLIYDNEASTGGFNYSFTTGKFGQGILFNGTGHLDYSTTNNFNNSQGTIMMWIKPEINFSDATTFQTFFYQYLDSSNYMAIFLNHGDSSLKFEIINSTNYQLNAGETNWNRAEWHHLAVTWGSSNGMEIYLDGIKERNNSYTEGIGLASTMSIGYSSVISGREINATLDDFVIFDTVLSAEQINETYQRNFSMLNNEVMLNTSDNISENDQIIFSYKSCDTDGTCSDWINSSILDITFGNCISKLKYLNKDRYFVFGIDDPSFYIRTTQGFNSYLNSSYYLIKDLIENTSNVKFTFYSVPYYDNDPAWDEFYPFNTTYMDSRWVFADIEYDYRASIQPHGYTHQYSSTCNHEFFTNFSSLSWNQSCGASSRYYMTQAEADDAIQKSFDMYKETFGRNATAWKFPGWDEGAFGTNALENVFPAVTLMKGYGDYSSFTPKFNGTKRVEVGDYNAMPSSFTGNEVLSQHARYVNCSLNTGDLMCESQRESWKNSSGSLAYAESQADILYIDAGEIGELTDNYENTNLTEVNETTFSLSLNLIFPAYRRRIGIDFDNEIFNSTNQYLNITTPSGRSIAQSQITYSDTGLNRSAKAIIPLEEGNYTFIALVNQPTDPTVSVTDFIVYSNNTVNSSAYFEYELNWSGSQNVWGEYNTSNKFTHGFKFNDTRWTEKDFKTGNLHILGSSGNSIEKFRAYLPLRFYKDTSLSTSTYKKYIINATYMYNDIPEVNISIPEIYNSAATLYITYPNGTRLSKSFSSGSVVFSSSIREMGSMIIEYTLPITTPTTTSPSGSGYAIFDLTPEQFEKGYSKILKKNWKIEFKFENVTHVFNVDDVKNDSVVISVESDKQTFELKINETKKLNLNNDGFYDLEIFLNGIDYRGADLTIKSIHEEIPAEKLKDKIKESLENNLLWLWIVLGLIIVIGIVVGIKFGKRKKGKR